MTEDERDELDRLIASTSSETLDTSTLSIINKDGELTPYLPNTVQLDFRSHRTRRDLVLKARQLGISTEIQADMFNVAITRSSLQATLAHDSETTQKLRRMTDRFWRGLPDHLRPKRGLDNKTTTTYPHTNSEVTIATAGSVNLGRGGTYTHLHGSEVAFWKDAASTMKGIMQGVSMAGSIVLESTPNGAQGWFYDQCMKALDGDPTWRLHFYPWWWDAEYRIALDTDEAAHVATTLDDDERALVERYNLSPEQIAWRRTKQREMGLDFAQEYPEDPHSCFLLSGMGYFANALDGVFTAPYLDTVIEGHRHVAGLDFGQTNDYTVCEVVDADDFEQRDILRINRLPWAEMRTRVCQMCDKWNVTTLIAEKNAMGSTNIEELRNEINPRTTIMSFTTDARSKPKAISGLRMALAEEGLKLLPDENLKRELQAFQAHQLPSGQWQYSAPEGEHDDTVIALALAVHAVNAAPIEAFRLGR